MAGAADAPRRSPYRTWAELLERTFGFDEKADNGVLLVLAPNDRKLKIETGKGVGDRLTDIEASHILRDFATSCMKAGRVFDAANEGTSEIGRALGGCAMTPVTVTGRTMPGPAPAPAPEPGDGLRDTHLAAWLAFVVTVFGVALRQELRNVTARGQAVDVLTFVVPVIAAVFGLMFGGMISLAASILVAPWVGIGTLLLGCALASHSTSGCVSRARDRRRPSRWCSTYSSACLPWSSAASASSSCAHSRAWRSRSGWSCSKAASRCISR